MVVRGDLGPASASGFAANYNQQLIVTELEEAATEGPGCTAPEPEVVAVATPVAEPIAEVAVEVAESEFVAFGNEPFWRVEISERGIIFAQAGGAEYGFPYKEPFASDTKWVYWGTLERGIPHKIQVAIEKQVCRDTMADAQYSYTATVTFDERKLSGMRTPRSGPLATTTTWRSRLRVSEATRARLGVLC